MLTGVKQLDGVHIGVLILTFFADDTMLIADSEWCYHS